MQNLSRKYVLDIIDVHHEKEQRQKGKQEREKTGKSREGKRLHNLAIVIR